MVSGGVVHDWADPVLIEAADPTTAEAEPLSFQYPIGAAPCTNKVYDIDFLFLLYSSAK